MVAKNKAAGASSSVVNILLLSSSEKASITEIENFGEIFVASMILKTQYF